MGPIEPATRSPSAGQFAAINDHDKIDDALIYVFSSQHQPAGGEYPIYSRYENQTTPVDLFRRLLLDAEFSVPWEDLERDAQRIAAAFDSDYASAARKAMLESGEDAEAAKSEQARRAAEEAEFNARNARDNAAPERLKRLNGDIDQALKLFDIERAKLALAGTLGGDRP